MEDPTLRPMEASDRDCFSVNFLGRTVDCDSLSDAVAVKTANDILIGDDPTPYRPDQLMSIASVLERYGCLAAADVLAHWAHFGRDIT